MPYKQFYLMPIELINNERHFKYMKSHENPSGYSAYSGMDYGNENVGLVSFSAELVNHNSLSSNTDVFQFPVDLATNVTPLNLVKIKSELNGRLFTSDWILPNRPFSGVVRNIAKQCMINQRFQGRFNSNIVELRDLRLTGQGLGATRRDELNLISAERGVVRNNSASLEIHLKDLMESLPSNNIFVHGIAL